MGGQLLTEWAIVKDFAVDVDSELDTFTAWTRHDSELSVDTSVASSRHCREILSADWVVLDNWRVGSKCDGGCAERESDGELHIERRGA